MDWMLSHLDWEGWGGGKILLHEIVLRFGLPRSLQSDNGTSFTSKATQGVSKALGNPYYLHCAWRPQSSGKVERANQFLKSEIKKKIMQETSLGWKETLPIALLHTYIVPKEQVDLSLWDAIWETFCLCQWPLPRSRGSEPPVLYHGHWAIPTGYTLMGSQPGPKRF